MTERASAKRWQERVAVFSILLAAALVFLVFSIVRGDRTALISGGLLSLSMGFSLWGQLRRRP